MNPIVALLAPLALLYPAGLADAPDVPFGAADSHAPLTAEEEIAPAPFSIGPQSSVALPISPTDLPPESAQVRIEGTVTIRITPRASRGPNELLAALPQGARSSAHIEERKIGKCLAAQGIVGVQATQDDKLLLFMRDRRIISVALEKACSARDFYSGFYIERHSDGQLCVKRDKLHSRAGAKCEVRQFNQLVAVRD